MVVKVGLLETKGETDFKSTEMWFLRSFMHISCADIVIKEVLQRAELKDRHNQRDPILGRYCMKEPVKSNCTN